VSSVITESDYYLNQEPADTELKEKDKEKEDQLEDASLVLI
jgi:hypothetical protein